MAGEIDVYAKQGLGTRMGFGKSPALIVIDFINAFANPAQFGGGNIPSAIGPSFRASASAIAPRVRIGPICSTWIRSMPM